MCLLSPCLAWTSQSDRWFGSLGAPRCDKQLVMHQTPVQRRSSGLSQRSNSDWRTELTLLMAHSSALYEPNQCLCCEDRSFPCASRSLIEPSAQLIHLSFSPHPSLRAWGCLFTELYLIGCWKAALPAQHVQFRYLGRHQVSFSQKGKFWKGK